LININRLAYAVDASPMLADMDLKNKETPPEPAITGFVGEDDVRKAMAQSKKMFIGPKTIMTPPARDLAGPHGILILTTK
jgi:hypothetical protein